MKRILPILLFLAPLLPAQTWFKVVPENGTATLPATVAAPITYRYGGQISGTTPAKWCDSVTVPTSTPPVVASNGSAACTVNKVAPPSGDPDPNVAKELDVQEQATSFVVQTVINGVKGSVTVPALPAPPPPPPTGPQTTATVPAPTNTSRLYWCDINQPNFQCVPARTDGK